MVKTTIKLMLLLIVGMFLISCEKTIIEEPPVDDNIFPEEFYQVLANKKVYLTSFGQSIEIEDLDSMMQRLENFEYIKNNYLTVEEIEDNAVLMIVVGCSVKGLYEVGITTQEESLRANGIFKQKQKKNLTVISFHIGGTLRRGSTSDELIEEVFSNSNFNIYYSEGNFDGKLSLFSYENNVKSFSYESPNELLVILKKLFIGDETK